MTERGRIRKAARQAKDWTQERATGTSGETARAEEKTGTDMATHKNGKAEQTERLEHASVQRKELHARQ